MILRDRLVFIKFLLHVELSSWTECTWGSIKPEARSTEHVVKFVPFVIVKSNFETAASLHEENSERQHFSFIIISFAVDLKPMCRGETSFLAFSL